MIAAYLVVPVLLLVVGSLDEEKVKLEKEYLDRVARIQNEEQAAMQILQDHAAVKNSPEAVHFAIKYLGVIRSAKGAPALCEQLEFRDEKAFGRDPLPPSDTHPACGALIAIGRPALEPLLIKISTSPTSPGCQSRAAFVLLAIVGERAEEELENFNKLAQSRKKFTDDPKHGLYKNFDQNKLSDFKIVVKKWTVKRPTPK